MEFSFATFDAFLEQGNIWSWSAAIGLALTISTLIRGAIHAVGTRLKVLAAQTPFAWDDIVVNALAGTRGWVIFVWTLYALTSFLNIGARADRAAHVLLVIATSLQVVLWGLDLIRGWHRTYFEARVARDASSAAALGLLYTSAQVGLITVIGIVALSHLGIDVKAMVAGVGLGGVGILFAAQNILADLLASLSIVLDKPFVVGDFIVVGDKSGTVEDIGLKTTRVRALTGEQIVFPNKDLLQSRVQNFKSLWQRRIAVRLGVAQNTALAQLQAIPGWIREFVERDEKLQFDRCHLAGFGSSSLDFELVFIVKDPDYNVYMERQQRLFFNILQKFEEEGVALALPAQTVSVQNWPGAAELTSPRVSTLHAEH